MRDRLSKSKKSKLQKSKSRKSKKRILNDEINQQVGNVAGVKKLPTKLIEETLNNYHVQVGVRDDKPIITEIHIGTTTNVRDKKTGGLVTSRSSAEIMRTKDAE